MRYVQEAGQMRKRKKKQAKADYTHFSDPPVCAKTPGRSVKTTDDKDATTCPICRITRAFAEAE